LKKVVGSTDEEEIPRSGAEQALQRETKIRKRTIHKVRQTLTGRFGRADYMQREVQITRGRNGNQKYGNQLENRERS
jgi:hypothetical protein